MQHDPEQIAAYLTQKHGLEGAKSYALEQVIETQAEQDLYALSIWREVKQLLQASPNQARPDQTSQHKYR
ncbi:MAG: hypothetical protein HOL85_06185 [Rhodospirillaceae bacterium]|jgi:hypothetical protein|nr:hypothetical protein [Rhodospirillaceae bacterium]